MLGISGRRLRQLVDEGRVPRGIFRRLGELGWIRYDRDALLAWAEGSADPEEPADSEE